MSGKYLVNALDATQTPQTNAIPGREAEMSQNDAGGYSFTLAPWKVLERFLILGTEGGSYYVGEQKLTLAHAKNLVDLVSQDGARVVNMIQEISVAGRAVSNDPALFALAVVSVKGSPETKAAAYAALPSVARTLSHLYSFMAFRVALGQRNMGKGMRKAVGAWFLERGNDNLAYQLVKYQQRQGWSARDLLRMARPLATDAETNALLSYAVQGVNSYNAPRVPQIIMAAEEAKTAGKSRVIELITDAGLPREAVPTQYLTDPEIWDALLRSGRGMPMTAMVRNLGNMTKSGLVTPLSDAEQFIVERLGDEKIIHGSRIHPISLLLAMKQYDTGRGMRGSGSWTPSKRIVSALDRAFYSAFDNVEPTGKRFLIGVDVSLSMLWSRNGVLTAAEVAAAMAMLVARTEDRHYIHGFAGNFVDLGISPEDSLQDVLKKTRDMNFGTTDCAIPMKYARSHNIPVDMFVVISDGDTWAGTPHPSTALKQYRKATGIAAKMLVLNTQATYYSIADPKDSGMLDIVGFDTSVPQILREFALQ